MSLARCFKEDGCWDVKTTPSPAIIPELAIGIWLLHKARWILKRLMQEVLDLTNVILELHIRVYRLDIDTPAIGLLALFCWVLNPSPGIANSDGNCDVNKLLILQ